MKKIFFLNLVILGGNSLFGAARSTDVSTTAIDERLAEISIAHAPEAIGILLGELRDRTRKLNPACDRALFVGPPGTGKTTLALALAQKSDAAVHFFKSRDLKGDKYARSGLVAIDTHLVPIIEMATIGRHVVIIDEFDRLIKAKEDEEDSEDRVAYFWQVLDNMLATGNIFFVGTCNQTENFPAPLNDRLPEDCRYHIGLPSKACRIDAFKYLLRINNDNHEHDQLLDEVAGEASEMSLRLIQRATLKASLKARRRQGVMPSKAELAVEIRSHRPRQKGFFEQVGESVSGFTAKKSAALLTVAGFGLHGYCQYRNEKRQEKLDAERKKESEKAVEEQRDEAARERERNEKFQTTMLEKQEQFQKEQRAEQEAFQIEQQRRSENLQKQLHEDGKSDGWQKVGAGAALGAAGTVVTAYAANEQFQNSVNGFVKTLADAALDQVSKNPGSCLVQ